MTMCCTCLKSISYHTIRNASWALSFHSENINIHQTSWQRQRSSEEEPSRNLSGGETQNRQPEANYRQQAKLSSTPCFWRWEPHAIKAFGPGLRFWELEIYCLDCTVSEMHKKLGFKLKVSAGSSLSTKCAVAGIIQDPGRRCKLFRVCVLRRLLVIQRPMQVDH